MRAAALLALLLLVSMLSAAALAAAQEPRRVFTEYCGRCHNGVLADSFEEVVARVRALASRYPSIDSAFMAAYGSTYKALMEKMRAESGHVPDWAYKKLYEFFLGVFREAAAGRGLTPLPATAPWEAETSRLCVAVGAAGLALAAAAVAYAVWRTTSS